MRACCGRWEEAITLQRALVADRGAEASVRDRFRLLRWALAAGCWEEALRLCSALEAGLASAGLFRAALPAWLALVRAVVLLQLGSRSYRRSLARALWLSRGSRGSAAAAALHLALIERRLRSGSPEEASLLERRGARTRMRPDVRSAPPAGSDAFPLQGSEGLQLESLRFSWDMLPRLVTGPRAADRLRAPGDPLKSAPSHLAFPGSTGEESGAGGAKFWISTLPTRTEGAGESPRRLPVWLVPLLAYRAEDAAPGMDPEERRRVFADLSRLAAETGESWARASALEALAGLCCWLAQGAEAPGTRDTRESLAQARRDLAVAAGLFGRLGWEERARLCENRWARLRWPSSGDTASGTAAPGNAAPGSPAPGSAALSLDRLSALRRTLAEAGFVTADRSLLRELAPLHLLATSPLPVLIQGESGTGKEVIAQALHGWSGNAGAFVPIHCGAIPRELLESELFGHARGAFTGAAADKPGLVEAADGGSLFLDEIGEMGPEAQMKMLRVLESGEVRRLGDLHPRRARLRLVAATHSDLDRRVEGGTFRLDLFHRIRGLTVRLRPLRERPGDIPLLSAHFLSAGVPPGPPLALPDASLALLLAHSWPGNARELKGVCLRAAHLCRALNLREIPPEFLGLGAAASTPAGGAPPSAAAAEGACPNWHEEVPDRAVVAEAGLDAVLEGIERRLILNALREHAWNRTRAARSLGNLSRTTLLSKMKRLGIQEQARASGDFPDAVKAGPDAEA